MFKITWVKEVLALSERSKYVLDKYGANPVFCLGGEGY